MKIHELQLKATPSRKRVGRGISAGQGKTAGRGTKGQNSRTGGGVRVGFAGGQNPLAKLLPKKRGFRALSRVSYQVVNLEDLARVFANGGAVDNAALAKAGLVRKELDRVKVLGSASLSQKLVLTVQAISAAARVAVEQAGGTVNLTPLVRVPSKKATRPKVEPESPAS